MTLFRYAYALSPVSGGSSAPPGKSRAASSRTSIEMERRGRTLATARHDRLQRGQARDGRKAPQSVSIPADGTRRAMSSNGPTRSRIYIWQNVAPHRNIVRRPVVEHLTRLAWLERPDPDSARAACLVAARSPTASIVNEQLYNAPRVGCSQRACPTASGADWSSRLRGPAVECGAKRYEFVDLRARELRLRQGPRRCARRGTVASDESPARCG